MDFAKRAFDHSYHIDPIVRSLLDTDFYKLLMLQFIWKKHPSAKVSFALTNRTRAIRLADTIDIGALREQMDACRTLRFRNSELVWLRGQTFYGQRGMFEEGFLDFLRDFRLPDYDLAEETVEGQRTGQFRLEFHGNWMATTLWEIHALAIINEMRYRTLMSGMGKAQLDIMYARAKVRLYDKLAVLADLDGLNLTDFGTRRRHSFLWQEHCVATAMEVLGDKFAGTSNALLAMKYDIEAKGTNAHELPMALAALAGKDDEALRRSQYTVLDEWRQVYRGGLLVMLPDTFGTTQFLAGLDPIAAMTWTGARPDSKEPIEAGEELIAFWKRTDPAHAREKLIIFADGLDVATTNHPANGADIPTLQRHFAGRARVGFGWGTNFTNDFTGCHPTDPDAMRAISLVCKVKDAGGRPAVKLSDNPTKATGDKAEVQRYLRVFGSAGCAAHEVRV